MVLQQPNRICNQMKEFKVQQLTMDHWIEGNMSLVLIKINFSNLLSHRFLSSFRTHTSAVLHLLRPGYPISLARITE